MDSKDFKPARKNKINLNLDFGTNTYSLAYEMFKNFQTNYFGKDVSETVIRKKDFKEFAPLTVIDCSKLRYSLICISFS